MSERAQTRRVDPVRKTVTVPWDQQAAFRRFTDEIAAWWPLKTHSVGMEQTETVVLEAREGGLLYEVLRSGERSVWGTVMECDPPRRIAFTWHPGRERGTEQRVQVSFRATDGGTVVELVHSGWEVLGAKAKETRDDYDQGWGKVLELFTGRADSAEVDRS